MQRKLHGEDMLTEEGRARWNSKNIAISALADSSYKKLFPLLDHNPTLAFLDSAATAQRPESVLKAQRKFYTSMNANALRGLYELSARATKAINNTRIHVAKLLGLEAKQSKEIVFTRNTTESLNLIAYAYARKVLKPGDEVCITIMEHHSNLIPWQQACRETGAKLVYMYPNDEGVIDAEEIRTKINDKTKIVSAIHVSNVLGCVNDIELMAEVAHEHNAIMVVDAAQSIPHFSIDIPSLGCDFLVFSAHKMYGPMGIGVLWGKMDLLEQMDPFLTGGEMIDNVTEQDATWAVVPEKFEAGTQDAAGIYALDAAVSFINEVGYENIIAREQALMVQLMRRLQELDFVRIIGSDDPALHHGVISFNVCTIHPHDVASIIDMDQVAIRAGHHCAQPLLKYLGIDSCCRASLAFYNDLGDIDQLIEGLKHVWRMFHG